jgi:LmbE family N-acetylglucosaminyl deacetylase
MRSSTPVALAVVAHPDDVEFTMAGTLLLLKAAGADIHIWNLANGCCGTIRHSRAEISSIRRREAQASARLAGATAHPSLFDDLAIFYNAPSLARVAAGFRRIKPSIVLTHPLVDYMEDHQNTARLAVTAAFSRGIKNYRTMPARPAWDGPVAIYHALPHGLRGPMGERPVVSHFIGIEKVFALKRRMLAAHKSQKEWLDASQGMDAYLKEMEATGRAVGRMSGRFAIAEGFSRHSHLGFSPPDWDPLASLLGGDFHHGKETA